ncbi:MAG: hypothetical protein KTR31_26270 [Myxococcales bacterium]|nr:hypothetical protein [Myxococcales bacterium]
MAETLQDQIRDRLVSNGLIVLDPAAAARVAPPSSFWSCVEIAGCPGEVLEVLPAQVGVVAQVLRMGPALVGRIQVFAEGEAAARTQLDVPIAEDNEDLFSVAVSRAVFGVLDTLPPSHNDVIMAATDLVGRDPAEPGMPPDMMPELSPATVPTPAPVATPRPRPPEPEPAPTPVAAPEPEPAPTRPAPARTPVADGSDPVEERLKGTGVQPRHVAGARGHFLASDLDPRDYLYRSTPHAGRLVIELRSGLGIGDVDRRALIRAQLDGTGQTVGNWYREGPRDSRNFRGEGYLGYAPSTVVDVGMVVGLQYARRRFNTGTVVDDGVGEPQRAFNPTQQVDALDIYLQPRVRAYVVPLGPVKPYLSAGVDIKFVGPYRIDQVETYATPGLAVIPGFLGAAGVMIDPGPIVGFFAEGSYARHTGARSVFSDGGSDQSWPAAGWEDDLDAVFEERTGGTVGVVGGVQFRL